MARYDGSHARPDHHPEKARADDKPYILASFKRPGSPRIPTSLDEETKGKPCGVSSFSHPSFPVHVHFVQYHVHVGQLAPSILVSLLRRLAFDSR